MKVIGAGFGRTGTLSLKVALEELGFGPCYHMQELMDHPQHARFWQRAIAGKAVDWRAFFNSYQATVDWPGCTFYQELMAVYPDAQVLLTVRDADQWYESAYETIYRVRESIPRWLATLLTPITKNFQVPNKLIWEGTFHDRFADRDYAIAIFQRHLEEVKRIVPADRLLVYEVKEGWGPLCRFLNVPVPEGKPFPHLNDTVHFRQMMVQQRIRLAKRVTVALLALVLLIIMIVTYFLLT